MSKSTKGTPEERECHRKATALRNGRCIGLLSPCGKSSCLFAKIKARLAEENLRAVERLVTIKRDDPVDIYNSARFV